MKNLPQQVIVNFDICGLFTHEVWCWKSKNRLDRFDIVE